MSKLKWTIYSCFYVPATHRNITDLLHSKILTCHNRKLPGVSVLAAFLLLGLLVGCHSDWDGEWN